MPHAIGYNYGFDTLFYSLHLIHEEFMRSAFRLFLLALLFSAAAVSEANHLSALVSSDVWWHLRTGLWIVQYRAIPRTGLFSQFSASPWISSSWGYEVLLASAYKLFGLRAIPILLMAFKVALAVVTFGLARAGRADLWTAVVLSALAQYVIPNLQPVPVVISILFSGLELAVLVQCRRSGEVRSLFCLPALFFVWANLHIQFVFGLILLAVFLIALFLEHALRNADTAFLSDRIRPLPLIQVSAIAGLSLLCTFATPYTTHLLPDVVRELYSSVSFQYGGEMSAMSFRHPQDFVLMLLVMAAFFALGRRRSLDVFELMALIAGTLLAFRIQRDAWTAVLTAIAVIACGFHSESVARHAWNLISPRQKVLSAALTAIILIAAALRLPDQTHLMNKISETFPAKACDFITRNHLPQPLFSTYSWGGFLTWYVPEYPAAIDSRIDLYGDDVLISYFQVITGKERLETNASLASARTLLLEKQSGMADALVRIPALSSQYRKLYSDDLATVFVRQ